MTDPQPGPSRGSQLAGGTAVAGGTVAAWMSASNPQIHTEP